MRVTIARKRRFTKVSRHRNCFVNIHPLVHLEDHAMSPIATLRRAIWTTRQFRGSFLEGDALRRVQEKRFRSLLRHTIRHSSFYREKYRGIDIERCSLIDLPTVTKRELMENFDRVVT